MIENPDKVRDRHLANLRAESRKLVRYDNYLEGEQPLSFIAPAVRDEIGDRVTELVINWPRLAVEAYDNRLDIEGFRLEGDDEGDDELWSIWQANDGDFISQQAHYETLGLSRSYAIVGEGDESSTPLITVESPFEAIHELDPRTHDVASGIKTWTDENKTRWVNLYHPEGRFSYFRDKGKWRLDEGLSEEHDYGLCQLVPLINSPRILGRHRPGKFDQRLGRSVFHDVIGVADAANKLATDMMVSAEFHAMPRRWAVGLTEKDFVDENGKPVDVFSLIASAMWTSENKDTKFGQFNEADLSAFRESIKLLAQVVGQLLALPPDYLGFTGDNPTSADAIRASERNLVKRAERMQQVLSSRWERVQRLVMLTLGYPDTPELRRIETLWRDPSTPTVAQRADATVKLVQAKDGNGRSLLPVQQAREDLGYTSTQQARMADWDRQDMADPDLLRAGRELITGAGRV